MQDIRITKEDLISFLSGASNPDFISEVPENELEDFREALKELASFLGLDEKIKITRINNSMKMGLNTDLIGSETYTQILKEWGFLPVSTAPKPVETDFEEPLPGFARRAYDGILESMVVLQTRDGQFIGNAIVIEVRFDTNNDNVLVIVCTDAGNIVIFSLEEIEERFHKPKWVAKDYINKNVRQRVERYYMND